MMKNLTQIGNESWENEVGTTTIVCSPEEENNSRKVIEDSGYEITTQGEGPEEQYLFMINIPWEVYINLLH